MNKNQPFKVKSNPEGFLARNHYKKPKIGFLKLFLILCSLEFILFLFGFIPLTKQWLAFSFVINILIVALLHNFWHAPPEDHQHSKPPEDGT